MQGGGGGGGVSSSSSLCLPGVLEGVAGSAQCSVPYWRVLIGATNTRGATLPVTRGKRRLWYRLVGLPWGGVHGGCLVWQKSILDIHISF